MSDTDVEERNKQYIDEHIKRGKEQAIRNAKKQAALLEPFTVKDDNGNVRSMDEPEVRRWVMSEKPKVYQQWLHTLEVASKIERERKQQKVRESVQENREKFMTKVDAREKKAKTALKMANLHCEERREMLVAMRKRRIEKVSLNQVKNKKSQNKHHDEMITATQQKLNLASHRRHQEDTKKQEASKNHWNDIVTVVHERKRILSAQRREKIEQMVLGDRLAERRLEKKEEKRKRRQERRRKRKEKRLKKNQNAIDAENQKVQNAILESQGYASFSKSGNNNNNKKSSGKHNNEPADWYLDEDEETDEEDEEESDYDTTSGDDDENTDDDNFSASASHGKSNKISAETKLKIQGKISMVNSIRAEKAKQMELEKSTRRTQQELALLQFHQQQQKDNLSLSVSVPGVTRRSRLELLTKLKLHLQKVVPIDKQQQHYHSFNFAGALKDKSEKELKELAAHRNVRADSDDNNNNNDATNEDLNAASSFRGGGLNRSNTNNKSFFKKNNRSSSVDNNSTIGNTDANNKRKTSVAVLLNLIDEETEATQHKFQIMFENLPDRLKRLFFETAEYKSEIVDKIVYTLTHKTEIGTSTVSNNNTNNTNTTSPEKNKNNNNSSTAETNTNSGTTGAENNNHNNNKNSTNSTPSIFDIDENIINTYTSSTDLDELEKIDTRVLDIILVANQKKSLMKLREEKDKAAEGAFVEMENRKHQREHEKSRFARPWESMKGNPVDYHVLSKKQQMELRRQKQEEQKKRQEEAFNRHLKLVDNFRQRTLEDQIGRIKQADHDRDRFYHRTVLKLKKHHRKENTIRAKHYGHEHEKIEERFVLRQRLNNGERLPRKRRKKGPNDSSSSSMSDDDSSNSSSDLSSTHLMDEASRRRHAAKMNARAARAAQRQQEIVANRLYSSPARKSRAELIEKLKAHTHKVMNIEKQRRLYRSFNLAGSTRTMSLQQLNDLAQRRREKMDEQRFHSLEGLPEKLKKEAEEHVERRQAFLDRVVEATRMMREKHNHFHDENNNNNISNSYSFGSISKKETDGDDRQQEQEQQQKQQTENKNNNIDHHQQQSELDDENHFLKNISATDLEELEKLDPRLLDAMLGENMKKQYLRMKEEREQAILAAEQEAEERKRKEEEAKSNLARPWEEMKGNPVGYVVLTPEERAERRRQREEEHKKRQEEAYIRHQEQVQEFRIATHEDQLKRAKEADQRRDGYQLGTVARLEIQRKRKEVVHQRAVHQYNQKKTEQLEEFEEVLRRPSFINYDDNNNNNNNNNSNYENAKPSSLTSIPQLVPSSTSPVLSNNNNNEHTTTATATTTNQSITKIRASQEPFSATKSSTTTFFPPIEDKTSSTVEMKDKSIRNNVQPRYLEKPKRFDDPIEARAYFEEQDRKHQPKPKTAASTSLVPRPPPPLSSSMTARSHQNRNENEKFNSSSTTHDKHGASHQFEKALASAEERRQQVLDKLENAEKRRKMWARQREAYQEKKRTISAKKEVQRERHVEKMYNELDKKRNAVSARLEVGLKTADERRLDALDEKAYRAKSFLDHHEELQHQHQQGTDDNNMKVRIVANETPQTARERNKDDSKPKFYVEKGNVDSWF